MGSPSTSEKERLINTINKKGFFLEEKAYSLLEKHKNPIIPTDLLWKNYLPKTHNIIYPQDRVEIDLVLAKGAHHLIIECKKTDCSWVFPKSLVDSDKVNYIYEMDNGLQSLSIKDDGLKIIRSEPMEIMAEEGKFIFEGDKLLKIQKREDAQKTIHKAVNQVLKQTGIWRWEQTSKPPYCFFLPVILTNAPLLFLDYDTSDISADSNLINYKSLTPVNCVVYNYPEILNWPNTPNEEPIKSVFIVNIHYFNTFLEWALELDRPTLLGIRNVVNKKSIHSLI
jgi:hypothetical protein